MGRSSSLPKSIKRVTLVDGEGDTRTVFRRSKKKDQSVMVKPFERMARRMAEGVKRGAEDYLDRHESSNEEQRDGWLLDLGSNVYKANTKAMKRARKGLPFSMDD
ncbi:MAG: hypothetical protein H6741_18070 [Alphaproteobacteria bacterium]|nr:hypothetical protein [Alphaproteobacteria bacterium]